MAYDTSQIRLKHIPKLEQIGDAACCRTYLYCFSALLPQQNHIDQVANNLEQRFVFSAELHDIPEDVEVRASVIISGIHIYLFGIRALPSKLEEIFEFIHSIQRQSRETWLY
jgi:hypothetical protein